MVEQPFRMVSQLSKIFCSFASNQATHLATQTRSGLSFSPFLAGPEFSFSTALCHGIRELVEHGFLDDSELTDNLVPDDLELTDNLVIDDLESTDNLVIEEHPKLSHSPTFQFPDPPIPDDPSSTSYLTSPEPNTLLDSLPRQQKKRSASKLMRDKKKSHEKRLGHRKAAQNQRGPQPFVTRPATLAKHVKNAKISQTIFNAGNIPSTSTGYTALRDTRGKVYTLDNLIHGLGFELEEWDGR